MRDVSDLFNDLKNGTLLAVSYAKPDGTDLFEAFAKNIIEFAQSNHELWESTAIFVTVDEGSGYYDSGFIQPVDFLRHGSAHFRVRALPMIAVSAVLAGRSRSHIYGEHSSFVKFVERNWYLSKLTARSRHDRQHAVIGDLFDMFDFGHGQNGDGDSQ